MSEMVGETWEMLDLSKYKFSLGSFVSVRVKEAKQDKEPQRMILARETTEYFGGPMERRYLIRPTIDGDTRWYYESELVQS